MAKAVKKKVSRTTRRKVDPVVVEIVRNGIIAVTEEMKTNLMRTAYNMIIYEALDFTTGLFTAEGETVSIGIGLPMFIRGMAETVKAKIKHFGYKNINPGDIYVTNDSYITGSHLNHFTFTLPIFHKGKLARYGAAEVRASIEEIMNRAEAAARARTRTIPDGVYEAESSLDDDGLEVGKRVPVKVKVTVKGDEMTIDLTDVSKQVRGFYNSAITTGYACAQVAYKCITSPTDYPINDGAFRSLKVIIPPGRIVSAVRPAPMRYWMIFPMTIVDTIFKALQPAIPDRVIAGHHADLVAPSFHGFNPKTSELFIGNFGPLGGGWGAKKTEDGVSATVCLNDGDTHNGPNEQAEAKFPIMIERFELIPDSGGAGRHRGGLGIARTVRALSPMTVNSQSDRSKCPPWGLDGGGDATGNNIAFRLAGEWKTDFPNAKVLVAQLKTEDAWRISSGGGGGYGPAFERPVADVREDVRQGYVSVQAAAERYGVVVDAETFAVDQAATDKLRAAKD